jgi:hypothetical protein
VFVSASLISRFRGAMEDFNDSQKSNEIIVSKSWLKPTGAVRGVKSAKKTDDNRVAGAQDHMDCCAG